jgi:drug/metabolite transporter (DMT)-like permease
MSRQLYMLGLLLLVAGGFLLIYGHLARYELESWGGVIFLAGLFIGILGVAVTEEKTKTALKALGTSFLIVIVLIGIALGFYALTQPRNTYFGLAIPGVLFFYIVLAIIGYIIFYLMEKGKPSTPRK